MINTLKYAKKLEEAGFSRQQAETNIQIIAEIVEGDVATKADLKQMGTDIGAEIRDLRNDVAKLEYRIIIKLSTIVGAMITLAIAVTAAVSRLL